MDPVTLHTVLFWVLAIATSMCAVALVVSQNIVRSATYLLFALVGTSGIFFLLGADFVGATQLLVYVGGTLVLVVFGVMLTAQGPFISMKTGPAEWAFSTVVGLLFFGVLAYCTVQGGWPKAPTDDRMANPRTSPSSMILGEALLGLPEATSTKQNITGLPAKVERLRKPVSYLLPFEIVSVHLLVVLIGAAYLARAKRRKGATP